MHSSYNQEELLFFFFFLQSESFSFFFFFTIRELVLLFHTWPPAESRYLPT
jgi:hypothetical protein